MASSIAHINSLICTHIDGFKNCLVTLKIQLTISEFCKLLNGQTVIFGPLIEP